ncbi:cell-division associated ABC transporter, membrane FtsX subunit [Amylolactobacillus amylotrophicus DSM 20534]|uniref:Cell division protein FtsX n=3 Tax=Amylolactobacillus TaxID=2767876 RepID=A0A0R1YKB9_9LACO|nr:MULTISPECIES: permease-like cell division protein FtsX [Amylolactobacillus]APT18943.1 cell division protein FtsX [Amylolactobacillus amylophilus DSM 20533 = JCM 1125]KRK38798.1 cell-division associated ABC transporter, membrane FtsX subunit [Amylolactobacillus amylotrophicus DSM 20534]KRM42559.1 cell-division associated ABC transporter, membrane FtsX subunit [Amylolactobacillus amylophilus DSM 20533 = JCM 1125]GED80019.1 cell division protein FtsX [Amylolactobacillus amylophilus]
MKTATINFHIRESLKSLKRNGWMTVAAISAVGVTLLLVGIFLSAVFNINKISNDIESDVRVRVAIQKDTTKAEREKLTTEISKVDGVDTIKFSSKENELKKLVKVYGSSFSMLGGDSNPLMDMLIIKAKNVSETKKIAQSVKSLEHVSEVNYGGNKAKQLFNIMATVRRIALIFSIILLLVAIFLIANTIRITIISRGNEIEIMQLVGATNRFIRTPFILEGAWTGILGSIIPIIIVDLVYQFVFKSMSVGLANAGYSLLSPASVLIGLDLLIVAIGAGIGALGSVISIRRYLKLS